MKLDRKMKLIGSVMVILMVSMIANTILFLSGKIGLIVNQKIDFVLMILIVGILLRTFVMLRKNGTGTNRALYR